MRDIHSCQIWEEPPDSSNNLLVEDGVVQGGTLNKLIQKLTTPEVVQGTVSCRPDIFASFPFCLFFSADANFQPSFIFTFHSFTTAEVFLSKLLDRYAARFWFFCWALLPFVFVQGLTFLSGLKFRVPRMHLRRYVLPLLARHSPQRAQEWRASALPIQKRVAEVLLMWMDTCYFDFSEVRASIGGRETEL